MPTVCLTSSEGAALGAAIQGAATANSVQGKLGTLRDLAAKLVTLDESTRATPGKAKALYAELLKKQTTLTRKLHAAGYL